MLATMTFLLDRGEPRHRRGVVTKATVDGPPAALDSSFACHFSGLGQLQHENA